MNYKNKIEFLLEKAKFNLTNEEKVKFEKDLIDFKDAISIFDNFDLEDVEAIRKPFVKSENFLREDIPETDLESEENYKIIMKNASNTKDGYILLKKGDK